MGNKNEEIGEVSTVLTSQTNTYTSLGKEVKISPKSKVSINKAGFKIEFLQRSAEVLIGIGKDHVAWLIMDEDAFKALKAGEELDIDTLKDFRNNLK